MGRWGWGLSLDVLNVLQKCPSQAKPVLLLLPVRRRGVRGWSSSGRAFRWCSALERNNKETTTTTMTTSTTTEHSNTKPQRPASPLVILLPLFRHVSLPLPLTLIHPSTSWFASPCSGPANAPIPAA